MILFSRVIMPNVRNSHSTVLKTVELSFLEKRYTRFTLLSALKQKPNNFYKTRPLGSVCIQSTTAALRFIYTSCVR